MEIILKKTKLTNSIINQCLMVNLHNNDSLEEKNVVGWCLHGLSLKNRYKKTIFESNNLIYFFHILLNMN